MVVRSGLHYTAQARSSMLAAPGILASAPGTPVLAVLLQAALIISISRGVGWLLGRLRQPQVMGEMVAGVLLGPSLLGWVWPQGFAALFPPGSVDVLVQVSGLGVIFFLFLIGLELEPALIRARGRSAVAVSLASIAVPFVLGLALALYFESVPGHPVRPAGVPLGALALFLGTAMSVTAFPVLARILSERALHRTHLGAVAITSAAVNDVVAWCLLPVVVAVAQVQSLGHAAWIAGLAVVYVLSMVFAIRPVLGRLEMVYDRQGRLSQHLVALIFVMVLASSLATASIGIHAMFGAFLMGLVMPKGAQFVRHLAEKLEDYTVVLLLPIFFAVTGLRTDLTLLTAQPQLWLYAAVVTFVACAGKIGGAMLAARFSGMGLRESSAIGILMNTRGLMELVLINVGSELGLIDQRLYTMLVVMTIATTAMTMPLLHLVYPPRQVLAPATARRDTYSVLIPVSLPKSGGPLVQLADSLMGADRQAMRLYALHVRRPAEHDAYRSGLDEAEEAHDEALAPLLAQARGRSLPVEPLSFVSSDVSTDICNVAEARSVDLVLMGFHKPVIGRTILGGTVHRVLTNCRSHVAIFVDRGLRSPRRVLVPYLGSAHDQLSLELACRMARNTGAHITVLHVVPPIRGAAGRSLGAKASVDRVFADPAAPTPVTFRVVEDPSPVGVVLYQAQQYDLVIVGVAEEWGLESHLFGWRPERIARDCPCSLLIVRRSETGMPPTVRPPAEAQAAVAPTPAT
jgi:Kef-type K+ transport system membrane component KefB/nucleotide-binding universal stress UspA family protein